MNTEQGKTDEGFFEKEVGFSRWYVVTSHKHLKNSGASAPGHLSAGGSECAKVFSQANVCCGFM